LKFLRRCFHILLYLSRGRIFRRRFFYFDVILALFCAIAFAEIWCVSAWKLSSHCLYCPLCCDAISQSQASVSARSNCFHRDIQFVRAQHSETLLASRRPTRESAIVMPIADLKIRLKLSCNCTYLLIITQHIMSLLCIKVASLISLYACSCVELTPYVRREHQFLSRTHSPLTVDNVVSRDLNHCPLFFWPQFYCYR
jgi:hypothetical protein